MRDDLERHSVFSLYSGALGMDIGLARTGRFRHLGCFEKDHWACETIRLNTAAGRIASGRLYEADIVRLDPRRVMRDLGLRPGELDLLAGGPPCQSYSSAGKRGGVQDARGLMLWHYLWFVEAFRPRSFVVENVTGLTQARLSERDATGSLLERFLSDLPEEYRVDCFIVNAVDHGVQQLRERVFLLGNRIGRVARFPAATHGPAESGLPRWRTLRDALAGLEDPGPGLQFCERHRSVLDMVPPGGNWKNLPPEVARRAMGDAYYSGGGRPGWFRRLEWDRPAPTVLTAPSRSMACMCHPDETRPLSVAECAAVQDFPAVWVFAGSVRDQHKQIGNAVPPGLGQVVGQAVAELLDEGVSADKVERFRSVDLAYATRMSLRSRQKTVN